MNHHNFRVCWVCWSIDSLDICNDQRTKSFQTRKSMVYWVIKSEIFLANEIVIKLNWKEFQNSLTICSALCVCEWIFSIHNSNFIFFFETFHYYLSIFLRGDEEKKIIAHLKSIVFGGINAFVWWPGQCQSERKIRTNCDENDKILKRQRKMSRKTSTLAIQ